MFSFKNWILESKVLAHISGASGSGKTTIAKKLSLIYPNVIFKDLDDFDDEATEKLKYSEINKQEFDDKMLAELAILRQKLMDEFVALAKKPIVFVGHHTEGNNVLYIPTENKFMLDTDAETSAVRAYKRSQTEDPKHRRKLQDLPEDIKEAKEVIEFLLKNGYKSMNHDQILNWMKGAL